MHRLILAVALALAGCAATGLRDPAVRMTSVVGLDLTRLVGTWHEVAALGRPSGALWQVEVEDDGELRVRTSRDGAGEGRRIGPGRLTLSQFDAPLWVLWADADMRTVAIGTPDGRFAMVLDRAATPAPDRLIAAREVLAWNGYDIAALK